MDAAGASAVVLEALRIHGGQMGVAVNGLQIAGVLANYPNLLQVPGAGETIAATLRLRLRDTDNRIPVAAFQHEA